MIENPGTSHRSSGRQFSLGEIFFRLTTEFLFVMVPLFLLGLMYILQGHTTDILLSGEWSFASCVLFGLAIVKYSRGCAGSSKSRLGSRAGFFQTLCIVGGLMPACALLILILLKEHSNEVWNEKMIEYLNEKVNSLQSGGPASSLVAPTKPGEPSSALIAVLQIMWFVASAGAFYFLGGGGEHLEALQETHRHHQSGDEVSAPPQVSEPFQSDGEE